MPTTRVCRPAKRSRSAPRTSGRGPASHGAARSSPSAGSPATPSGLDRPQVPEASMTARARRSTTWPSCDGARRGTDGPLGRWCGSCPRPRRLTASTRVPSGYGRRARASRRAAPGTIDEICSGRKRVPVGELPVRLLEQSGGRGVDVVLPRGEQSDVAPLVDGGARPDHRPPGSAVPDLARAGGRPRRAPPARRRSRRPAVPPQTGPCPLPTSSSQTLMDVDVRNVTTNAVDSNHHVSCSWHATRPGCATAGH